jgi:hypothetical protein
MMDCMKDAIKARSSYKKIGNIYCPDLQDKVTFSSVGFKHLIWKGNAARLKTDQQRRFKLIPVAAEILKKPGTLVANEDRTFQKTKNKGIISKTAHFWAFEGKHEEKTVRVIVRQFEGGQKHFFSVFEANKKSTPSE